MHDPMVVAHEIPSLVPHRDRIRERRGRRWGFDVMRRTNPENLGQRVYPWWRPHGYTLRIAGRAYKLRHGVTIWHVEPGGRDAFEVCKHASRWKWHVHHWHLQIHTEQRLRRFLLERCELCGHRFPWGYAPVSHQWDAPRSRWRDGVVRRAYHHECSSLGQLRNQRTTDEDLIRHLFSALRLQTDEDETELLARLTDPKSRGFEFRLAYRLTRLLGYERNDDYQLVKASPSK